MDIVALKHNSASQDLHWLHRILKQSKANEIKKPPCYIKLSTWTLTADLLFSQSEHLFGLSSTEIDEVALMHTEKTPVVWSG